MRHKKNSLLQFESGVQKQSLLMRNMLTSLVTYGQITTTPKRAKVLKSEANKLFNRLVRTVQASEQDGVRRCISYVKSVLFTDVAGKKLITELLPKFLDAQTTSFIADYKLGMRKGDASEEVMIKII
ncbi:MAG: hypothetical protein RL023_291 [Candidatus Parcubacteria bacterium]|jgi:ribosomal protein L17